MDFIMNLYEDMPYIENGKEYYSFPFLPFIKTLISNINASILSTANFWTNCPEVTSPNEPA